MSENQAKKLFGSITNIDDDIIEEAQTGKAHKKSHSWIKWGAVAACLCLIVTGTVAYMSKTFTGINNPTESVLGQEQLLAAINLSETLTEAAGIERYVPVEGRLACYTQIYVGKAALTESPESPESTEVLAAFVGEEYTRQENQTWYRTGTMEELKYLISKDDAGILRLWEFKGFFVLDSYLETMQKNNATQTEVEEFQKALQTEYPNTDVSRYTYGDVYRIIYCVDSVDEIVSITASPSTSNNTDSGKAIQEKVGTHNYTDRSAISVFYDCTVDVTCYGTNVDWESINSDLDKYTYSFSTDAEDKLTSGEETWGSRYLTVTLQSGTTIDSWKYRALNGQFYEYGGISTVPLDENSVHALNKIFGIE